VALITIVASENKTKFGYDYAIAGLPIGNLITDMIL
jgi:hypothetical protein